MNSMIESMNRRAVLVGASSAAPATVGAAPLTGAARIRAGDADPARRSRDRDLRCRGGKPMIG